ncbi:MAG: hypothetical protein JWQ12_2344 [Glaciihabitans sp.]|jgi:hypothetical protein|nr:hypothetical protein [Glaciihabitans sp.]
MMKSELKKVYVLTHDRMLAPEDTSQADDLSREPPSDTKLIGIFSSLGLAQEALSSAAKLPGFSLFPDSFAVTVYEINNRWNRERQRM